MKRDYTEAMNDDSEDRASIGLGAKGALTQRIHGAVPQPPPSKALTARPDGTFSYRELNLTKVGVLFPTNFSQSDFSDFGRMVMRSSGAVQWWVGDWINYGKQRGWKSVYAGIVEDFGYQTESLHNIASVAKRVTISRRREVLSFAHHAAVASKSAEEQNRLLELAEGNGWTVKQLEQAIRDEADSPTVTLVHKIKNFFANEQRKLAALADEVDGVGGFEKSQISQLIEQQATWLEELGRKVRGE